MRELTNHKVVGANALNEELKIEVLDEPGSGGACHEYEISYNESKTNVVILNKTKISFQNGPIKENGVNGISQEALLAIVEDRLAGFDSGEYATKENAMALFYVRQALQLLKNRTLERMSRGVEGTMQK